jgi:hypothetical protein
MQTSTKVIIGGVIAVGALYLLWPKTAAASSKLPSSLAPPPPAPLLTVATKPGAILLQPDPNSMALIQMKDASGTPIWGLSYQETVSMGGNVIQSVAKQTAIGTGASPADAIQGIAASYPVSAGPPPNIALMQALLTEYAAGVPTAVSMSSPAGGSWTATYSVSANYMNPDGTVGSKTSSGVVPMYAFPSSGPQPSAGDTTTAVYTDLLQNL